MRDPWAWHTDGLLTGGTAFRNCFSKGCAHMTVSKWDSHGALAILQTPETPHLGLHSPNQYPRRPLKFEFSPHGLNPLCTQRHNSSKQSRPLAKVPDTGGIRAGIQTQDSITPAVSPAPAPTPHPGCQKTLWQHRRFLRSALQLGSLAGFHSHPRHGTELLKIHRAPHYMKRLGNSLS